jgi:hypothetical protein
MIEASINAAKKEEAKNEPTPPPTLGELLTRPREESEWVIQYNAHHFSAQVEDLNERQRQDLRQRLVEWQEDKPFFQAITWKKRGEDGNSWSIENWANALVWLGPGVALELEPERWAEIVVSGVLFDTQYRWLQETASEEGKLRVAELCESEKARVWNDVLRATPDPMPEELIASLVGHLQESDPYGYAMRAIAERLAGAGELEALRQLAAKASDLEEELRPVLARAGDVPAVDSMLAQLASEIRAGEPPDHDDLGWLEGAIQTRYLPRLFECLALLQTTPAKRTGLVTTTTPLVNAIRLIGGDQAVLGYDELLATNEPNFRFLRLQRHAIAEAELAKDGVGLAPAAAEAVGVPALE